MMSPESRRPPAYRGRLAPSPTGLLHLGHARTFWIAATRAARPGGVLVLRNDDLDRERCRPEYTAAMLEDLRWFGLEWAEGPDCGGPRGPYQQSGRLERYRAAFERLRAAGLVYPCLCSRQDIAAAVTAPHEGGDEIPYPGTCRGRQAAERPGRACSWRFRVPDGREIAFDDGRCGPQRFVAGRDFGDFVVWRPDDGPAYHTACVVDDAGMGITEVVRGADLLPSTARQILLYEALGWPPPAFYHCELLRDHAGRRLAKRHDSLSLRALRAAGATPEALRQGW